MSRSYRLRARARADGGVDLLSPTVGIFRATVREGEIVVPEQCVGTLELLGVRYPLRAPKQVFGRVVAPPGGGRSRSTVEHGQVVLCLGAEEGLTPRAESEASVASSQSSLAFCAPMSGRFYVRPSPTEEAFVNAGDTVQRGQTIGLLEVMKTFNRIAYEGDGLPERAIVDAIVPEDGDDVVRGDVILALRHKDEA